MPIKNRKRFVYNTDIESCKCKLKCNVRERKGVENNESNAEFEGSDQRVSVQTKIRVWFGRLRL